MRAVFILGPGNLSTHVEKFQRVGNAQWTSSFPASSKDGDGVVIFGGDGTVHRHLRQLVSLALPVLIVPCGSGNDFARALKLRRVRDSLAAWQALMAGANNVRSIDLGIIREAGLAASPHYFCCVAGTGIDAVIARRCNALPRWIRARGGYTVGALQEILRSTPFQMKVSADRKDAPARPTILAAFANTAAYGGGMKIAPQAHLDDGRLDVCIVRAMGRFKLLCLFPTVYFGRHLGFHEVEYSQTEKGRIETEYPLDVYADGEYVCQTPVEFSIARNALKVVVPA